MTWTDFLTRPKHIKAWRWDGDTDWKKAPEEIQAIVPHWSPKRIALPVKDSEGRELLWVDPGDWIILEPDGSLRPCKPGVFRSLYARAL